MNYRVLACVAAFASFLSTSVAACETALLLSIDVSNSIDVAEYRLQTDGLADAILDPEVTEALVSGQVALSVMQWSGEDLQELSLPWTRIQTPADAVLFAALARSMPRAFVLSDTAPGNAVQYALAQFADVPDCERNVIDVSGDGTPNSGIDVRTVRNLAERQGVTINGIAIESLGLAITNFFRLAVITRDGFVITARTHRDYPRAIRQKILREVSRVLG